MMYNERMAQQKSKEERAVIFEITGRGIFNFVVPLPAGAFIVCVILSIIYDLDASTRTHCGVANYLPSISAAIGGFTPQRYIWRICIGLHSAPRFMLAIMHWNFYRQFSPPRYGTLYSWLVPLLGLLHIAENAFLVTLTFVSSTENYKIHESSFIAFMIFSELYMVLTLIIFKWSRSGTVLTRKEQKSFKLKLIFALVNISAFMLAGYFFYRHNTYCETGMYTWFAFCEYTIVSANIAFHGVNQWMNFGDSIFSIQMPPYKLHRKQQYKLPL